MKDATVPPAPGMMPQKTPMPEPMMFDFMIFFCTPQLGHLSRVA